MTVPQKHDNMPDYRSTGEQDAPSLLSDFNLYLFGQGKNYRIYEKMGAHLRTVNGVAGVNFALWAPNALAVSVIGDFNDWQPGANPMHLRHQDLGIWECFVPGIGTGALYKYAIASASTTTPLRRAIPMALPPNYVRRRPVSSSQHHVFADVCLFGKFCAPPLP